MRYSIGLLAIAACLRVAAADGPMPWAYAIAPPAPVAAGTAAQPPPPDTTPKRLPGSGAEFTRAQITDRFGPADWFPGDHPTMPDVVAHGKKPDVWACALCHYPNGKGRPENAGIAGLPTAYFIQQMNDFRSGNRKSAEPRKSNTNLMINIAKGMTDDEIKAAAEYFGSMKWTPWIQVEETNTVAKTRNSGGMYLVIEGGGTEPLGTRIIETPENAEATEILRNPRSGFIAYVPVGSVKRGEALVTKAGSKTVQCGVCHGADLRGLGPVPGIAGRSPSYLARQLYDMKAGARNGTWTQLMKPVVANLSDEDILDIVAYTARASP
jgi:cytochrome c553